MRYNFNKIREKCAVFGVSIDGDYAAEIAYNALLTLQHRGQEGAGIAVIKDNNIICRKSAGLVTEIFPNGSVVGRRSGVAIGHCLCSSVSNLQDDVQPSVTEYLTGRIAVVLNGRITNVRALREELMKYGLSFMGMSDGEVLSKFIAYYCMRREEDGDSFLDGVKYAVELLKGSFSLIIMSTGKGGDKLVAVRDSSGFRPLCIGVNAHGFAIASESCAFDICGFSFARDVKPGEIVQIENGRLTYEESVVAHKPENTGLCVFEYVYLARPDSFIDNLSVYEARVNMGRILARENKIDADIVCGVPDSGMESALGYSLESGVPLVPGFMRNRYIGRTFINPTQTLRDNEIKLKLNPLKLNIDGKRVILVDDSIVLGKSTKKVIPALKKAGAREDHMLVSSPPIKFDCEFGCVEKNEKKPIASYMSIAEICEEIGADSLNYISIGGLRQACAKCSLPQCMQCFSAN